MGISRRHSWFNDGGEEKMVVKNLRNCRGVAAVEFALIAPILFVLLFGIIEFGLLLYNREVITESGREGARYGAVCRVDVNTELQVPVPPGEIEAVINNYIARHLITFGNQPNAVIQVNNPITGPTGEPFVEVTVQYNYDFLVLPSFIAGLIPQVDLTTRTVMRIE